MGDNRVERKPAKQFRPKAQSGKTRPAGAKAHGAQRHGKTPPPGPHRH